MSYDQHGNWINDGAGCGTNSRQLPTVQFIQGQPEPYCPAPGAEVLATQTQGRVYNVPNKSCRLELADIVANTTYGSLLVLGNESCFTDAQLRTIFGISDDVTPVIRVAENCEVFEHQTIETSLTFTIEGTATVSDSQFTRNGQAFYFGLTNRSNNSAFKVTRAFRCDPCESGEKIQSFGGEHCSPLVIGKQQLFGLIVGAGVTLTDVVLCPCAYSVDSVVRCVAPATCPAPPPAPPVATFGPFNGNGNMQQAALPSGFNR